MFVSANVRIFYELTKLGSFSVFLYICPKMSSILFNEMKKRVLYIFLLLSLVCKAQDSNMKYFNEEQFNDWEKAGDFSKEERRLRKEDKEVHILKNKDTLNINISSINNSFTEGYDYSPKTKVCTTYIKKYDEQGNLIKEENYEKMYKISIEKLIEIAEEKLSIDINPPKYRIGVSRYDYDENRIPVYIITIPSFYAWFSRIISIDANTGEILFDEEIGGVINLCMLEGNDEERYLNKCYPLKKKKRNYKLKNTKKK